MYIHMYIYLHIGGKLNPCHGDIYCFPLNNSQIYIYTFVIHLITTCKYIYVYVYIYIYIYIFIQIYIYVHIGGKFNPCHGDIYCFPFNSSLYI
jgi:hypothetical protein